MEKRGYDHKSPLEKDYVCGCKTQDVLIHTRNKQMEILRNKQCDCKV
jgi:hypothetical protein